MYAPVVPTGTGARPAGRRCRASRRRPEGRSRRGRSRRRSCSSVRTRCGARAVPEPWNATTGFVSSNSAIPPVARRSGSSGSRSRRAGVADAVGEDGLRIDGGRAREAVAAVRDDAGHVRSSVVEGDERGVRPLLRERQRLRRWCPPQRSGRPAPWCLRVAPSRSAPARRQRVSSRPLPLNRPVPRDVCAPRLSPFRADSDRVQTDTARPPGYHFDAMRRYHVTTFGCQMNAHDSERIKGMLESLGLGEAVDQAEADVLVFNTCTIREKPDQRLRGAPRAGEGAQGGRPGAR